MYSKHSTTHTYNLLLNGRWHSGTTPTVCGQLDIEKKIIKLSGMKSRSVVLDFGCGNGVVSCDYNILTGATVHAVSNQPSQISMGYELSNSLGLNRRVQFTEMMNNLTIPFPDNMFDIVTATESLCHIKTHSGRQSLFKEFKRVLKPDGVFVGEDWCHLQPNSAGARRINKVYGTDLIHPGDYAKIDISSSTETRIIKPDWEGSLSVAVYHRLLAAYYSIRYPKLPLECPYSIDYDKVDTKLVKGGKYLERDPDFRLCMITVRF
jgi:SAM-dependent methyltransferase